MTPTKNQVVHKLLEFVRSEYAASSNGEIRSRTKLFSAGIIDSFSFHALLSHVEKEYTVKIDLHTTSLQELDTINGIADMILRELTRAPHPMGE